MGDDLQAIIFRSFSKYLAAALVFLGAVSAQAQDSQYLGGPPPGEDPLEVQIGFNLVTITDVNEREETIDFEAAIYMEWMDPRHVLPREHCCYCSRH